MRSYTIGINVDTADELAGMGAKVRAFIDEIGDGTLDIQLAINPTGRSAHQAQAIGFIAEGDDYHEEDD